MKKAILILMVMVPTLALFSLSSCKNDDDVATDLTYENLTLEDIVSNSNRLSDEEIEASNSDGYTLNICDVIIYKTNSEHYGKLKILNFDDNENKKLTIKAVSYNDDGSVFSQTDNLEIRGTWTCDLDAMLESGPNNDFHWQRENGTDTNLSPIGNAIFAVY